tara:strand:+ start:3860 stop:4102 length:243 start_codon:yes stop_codon:yes gene_type:complete
MTTKGYKEKIQILQQTIDRLEDRITHLNNELLLCKESNKIKSNSKGNSNSTPMVKFSSPDVAGILKDRARAMKMYSEKKR